MATLLRMDNDVFAHYAFYTGVLGAKVLLTTAWVSKTRLGKRAFGNPEDVKAFAKKGEGEELAVAVNEDVERIRRIHQHDIENIPLFALVGLLYVTSDPDPTRALWHFRVFLIARLCHSMSYRLGLQPWRFLSHVTGVGVIASMLVPVLRAAKF